MWLESWREIDWAMKLCREGLWHVKLHEYRQARLKGRIDCAGRGRSTYEVTDSRPPTILKQEARSRNQEKPQLFTSSKTDLLSHCTFENHPKLSSVGHFQSEQAFTPPKHFRTLFGFSEKFGNCRPPLMQSVCVSISLQFFSLSLDATFILVSFGDECLRNSLEKKSCNFQRHWISHFEITDIFPNGNIGGMQSANNPVWCSMSRVYPMPNS